MNHEGRRRIGEPGRGQQKSKWNDYSPTFLGSLQHQQKHDGQQATGQQFGERTSPVDNHKMVRICSI